MASAGGGTGASDRHSSDGHDTTVPTDADTPAAWEDIDPSEVEMSQQLGGGGFAVVYKGRWRGENVAVKAMFDPKVDDALKAEFMDELHVMRSLSHPNIVSFKGACTRPPRLCFVMELCGPSIFSILHGGGRKKPNLSQRVQWAREVADAMAYLHGKSPAVIHRDLKSHNVLIARDGSAKLCDFGLVRQRTTNAGTPNYMAPELLQSRPFSRKVDVFAFGMLLHELLTGKLPFHGLRPATIVEEVPKGSRPDIPENEDVFPRDLQALVRRCWDTDPNERPEFAEVVRVLQQWKPRRSAISSATAKLGGGDALDSLLGK